MDSDSITSVTLSSRPSSRESAASTGAAITHAVASRAGQISVFLIFIFTKLTIVKYKKSDTRVLYYSKEKHITRCLISIMQELLRFFRML